jgi:hypothetical protein
MYQGYCEPTAQFADVRVSGQEPVDQLVEKILQHIRTRIPQRFT